MSDEDIDLFMYLIMEQLQKTEIKTEETTEIVKEEVKEEIKEVKEEIIEVKEIKQKNINRCFTCNKKLSLAGNFKCKCQFHFCSLHRLPFEHNCSVNEFEENKKRLEKENVLIINKKVDII